MSGVFVRSRELAPRQDSPSPQGAPSIVTTRGDPTRQQIGLPRRLGRFSHPAKTSRPISSEAAPSIGSWLYLSSVGLVAAGIAAVFFGTGFSLLAPPAGGTIFESATRASSEVIALPPLPDHDDQVRSTKTTDTVQSSASSPAPAEAHSLARSDPSPQPAQAGTSAPPVSQSISVAPPAVTSPTSDAAAPPALAHTTSRLSAAELGELLGHGDYLLRTGDVASARLFYERAANAGDGRAALRLGATFDPAFLVRFGGKVQADAALARSWYGRVVDLGAVEAKGQLNRLETRQGK